MEPVGVTKIGSTSYDTVFVNTADMEVIPAVLPGGSAVTYPIGTALLDGTTVGTKAKYTNSPVVADEAVGTGNGTTTTFDLDYANVIASTVKGYVAGVQWDTSISVGTGAAGVDQIVFRIAPTNAAAIVADYTRYSSAKGVTGACVLMEAAATTVAGGNVTVNALVGGTVNSAKVKDSAAALVDSVFKDALNNVRFS